VAPSATAENNDLSRPAPYCHGEPEATLNPKPVERKQCSQMIAASRRPLFAASFFTATKAPIVPDRRSARAAAPRLRCPAHLCDRFGWWIQLIDATH